MRYFARFNRANISLYNNNVLMRTITASNRGYERAGGSLRWLSVGLERDAPVAHKAQYLTLQWSPTRAETVLRFSLAIVTSGVRCEYRSRLVFERYCPVAERY
jgi:hypothetical protein